LQIPSASALIDLNSRFVNYFYAPFAANAWHGLFLKVIDGTTLCLLDRGYACL
jgi:hypothetical protein